MQNWPHFEKQNGRRTQLFESHKGALNPVYNVLVHLIPEVLLSFSTCIIYSSFSIWWQYQIHDSFAKPILCLAGVIREIFYLYSGDFHTWVGEVFLILCGVYLHTLICLNALPISQPLYREVEVMLDVTWDVSSITEGCHQAMVITVLYLGRPKFSCRRQYKKRSLRPNQIHLCKYQLSIDTVDYKFLADTENVFILALAMLHLFYVLNWSNFWNGANIL